MPAKTRLLALAFGASVGIHAVVMAWPSFGGGDGRGNTTHKTLSVRVVEAKPKPPGNGSPSARRSEPAGRSMLIGEKYYTSAEVDVKATPLGLKTSVRTSDNFPLGRIATVKLKLFINERGTVDRFEIIDSEGLTDKGLVDDFRDVVFRPAELGGRPVKSEKVVGISFIPQ